MKKIFSVIIFLSSLFSVCAQAPAPSGLPAPYSTGYYRIGWVQTDSGFIYALRDTTVRSKYIGLTFFWADNGHDSSSWIWNGRRYVKQLNSEDTLLGRFLITPSFLFSQGFLKVATDTIWRTPGKDSLQFTIGGRYHSLASVANSGSVFNQDSIKHRFVDTGSVARNLYTLSWDSVNKKWILAAPGSGGGGSGTVTTVGFTAGNGFTGNFANPSTTPNLTIGTSVTGLIFGNGTAISNATVSSPLTYSAGTLGIQTASGSVAGALASADFTSFAAKQTALSGTGYLKFAGTTPSYLTPTQVTADLNLFTSSLQGLVPLSGGGTTNFLRADGTWAAPSGGSGNTNSNIGSGYRFAVPNTNNIKTLFCAGCTLDSTTNANALTLTVTAGGSGTVTIFSAGTLSPLFTTSVATATTTPALTFTLSTAAANTAFGNFTGSTAAPAYGKLPLAAIATGTANTLIGYDGSGNPSGITVSTGLSLASGILTATATTPTFQQTLTAGSTLTTNNTVNQATHNFIWSGGGVMQFDSTKYTQGYINPVLVADSLSAFGNSIGLGANATLIPDSAYNGRLARNYQKTLYNHSISGIKIYDIIGINMATINPGHHSFTSFEGGLNDLRSFPSTNVFNAINNSFNAAIINQYLASYVSGSDASITRVGTWTTGFPINTAGFGKTPTAAYTTHSGDSISTTVTGTSIAIQVSGQVGSGATLQVRIDGVVVETFSTANQVETGSYIPMARVYTGLTNTTHTLSILYSTSTGLFILDYVGTLVATPTMPFIAFDVPYLFFTSGTGAGSDTKIRTDTVNNRIAATVAFYKAKGWPVYEGKTNNFYTATLGVDLSTDSVHPNNTGHARIFQSALAVINASSFTGGTLVYSNDGHFYGQSLTGLNQLAYFSELNLQAVLTNGSTMLTNMSINGNGYSAAFSNFTTMSLDSMLIIKNTGNPSTAIVNVHGQFAAYGSTAAIQILSRNGDTTKGFQFVTGGGAVSISDLFNGGRNILQIDSGYRSRFLNDQNSLTVNSSPVMGTVYIDGNRNGRAGHAPFKIDSGLLMTIPEKYAFENNGLHFYWTDRTGTRFQLDQQTGGSGVSRISPLDSLAKSANGLQISGVNLVPQSADASFPGFVTTGAQTFAGAKIFNGQITFPAATTGAASLLITASAAVNPTSPTSGQLWWNGTNLNFRTGSTTVDLLAGGYSPTLTYTQLATTNTLALTGATTQTFLTATQSLAGLLDTGRAKSIDSLRNGLKTFNLYFANGLTASTVIPDSAYWGGTLNQNTIIGTAGFSLSFTGLPNKGLGGSTDSSMISDASGKLWKVPMTANIGSGYRIFAPQSAGYKSLFNFNGSIDSSTNTNALTLKFGLGGAASDADYTAPNGVTDIELPAASITANRNLTVPNAAINSGGLLVVRNNNLGSSFTWTVTSGGGLGQLRDINGTDITSIPQKTTLTFTSNGSYWILNSSYGTGALRYTHTIFTPTTGSTVSLVNNQYNIINPAGALVALTVNLPSSPVNNDVVYIKFTQTISTVTYGNGTVVDGITAPTAGGLTILTYDSGTTSWY